MADNDHKTLILQSSPEEVQRLKSFLKELQVLAGYDEEKFAEIRLALNEAVMNAMKHGNDNNPAKNIYISAKINEGTIVFKVTDEGDGFDLKNIPNPTDKDNLLKPSGRGIFLIRQQADQVSYSKEKSTLTMQFNLDKHKK